MSSHFARPRRFTRALWLALTLLALSGIAGAQGFSEPQRQFATIERVNMSTALNQSANGQFPTMNADGRYVVFWTDDSRLIPNDNNNTGDIYLRDRQANETVRVSIGNGNVEANNLTFAENDISDNGNLIVYASNATNLIQGDTNGFTDVFVFDRGAGAVARVSVPINESTQTNGPSFRPVISGNGRFVAFRSQASNIVNGRSVNRPDIFLFDRAGTVNNRVAQINVHTNGTPSNAEEATGRIAINDNGNFIAFESIATNLVNGDTNGKRDIFLRDRTENRTIRVSRGLNGEEANGDSSAPAISANGRFIAFRSLASNLVEGDTNNRADIFVYDVEENTTTRVSLSRTGAQGNNDSDMPSISNSGRFVSFQSAASNLVEGDVNNTADIFVHDRNTGVTTRANIAGNGAQTNGFTAPIHSLSGDAAFIAFESVANNLVQNDTNNSNDIFVARGGPNSPSNLTITDITTTSLTLTWDDNANNENRYEIERRRGSGLFQIIEKLPRDSTTYDDTNLRPCTQYSYWVFAVNGVARSASELVTARTAGCPPGEFALKQPNDSRPIVNVGSLEAFTWGASLEAATYAFTLVDLDASADLVDTVLNAGDICDEAECAFAVSDTLRGQLDNGRYLWEVTATNPIGSTEADNNPLTFTVDDTLTPRAFALETPANGALLRSGEAVNLSWRNNPDVALYDFSLIKISNNPGQPLLGTVIDKTGLTPKADGDSLTCVEKTCVLTLTSGEQAALNTGLYSWTVIGSSPGGARREARNAAWVFRVNEGDINLLKNGGFEDYDAQTKLPATWEKLRLTKDVVACNQGTRVVAHEGQCAFRFTGGPGGKRDNAALAQEVDLSLIIPNDTLRFSGFVSGKQHVGTFKANLRITYQDATNPPDAVTFTAPTGAYAYDDFRQSITVAGAVASIKVRLIGQGRSGSILVDGLRVEIVQTGALRHIVDDSVPSESPASAGFVPLPPAPGELRGQ